MIRRDMIPDEVMEAAASDIVHTLQSIASKNGLTMTGTEEAMNGFREVARSAIQAALNAWPGVRHDKLPGHVRDYIILPLPQEVSDEGDELVALREENERLREALSDPTVVHANMLAGVIAKPFLAQIIHIYGEDALRAALEEGRT